MYLNVQGQYTARTKQQQTTYTTTVVGSPALEAALDEFGFTTCPVSGGNYVEGAFTTRPFFEHLAQGTRSGVHFLGQWNQIAGSN